MGHSVLIFRWWSISWTCVRNYNLFRDGSFFIYGIIDLNQFKSSSSSSSWFKSFFIRSIFSRSSVIKISSILFAALSCTFWLGDVQIARDGVCDGPGVEVSCHICAGIAFCAVAASIVDAKLWFIGLYIVWCLLRKNKHHCIIIDNVAFILFWILLVVLRCFKIVFKNCIDSKCGQSPWYWPFWSASKPDLGFSTF